MISMLIPGTSAKQCYLRGKKLKLKKLSIEQAMEKSKQLNVKSVSQLQDKKAMMAVKQFLLAKQSQITTKQQVQDYLSYLNIIAGELQTFKAIEDNLILLGGNIELNDINRATSSSTTRLEFSIVPLTPDQFIKSNDAVFVKLIQNLGVYQA